MNNLKEKILKEYSIEKNIKILVNYIKPSFLFKTNILTPIHLGRSIAKDPSKDGTITQDDLKWLYDNCIGDDDFISVFHSSPLLFCKIDDTAVSDPEFLQRLVPPEQRDRIL